MPLAKCGGCGRFLSPAEAAKCGKCTAAYHRACVGLPSKGNITPSWRCPECRKNVARDNKAETPIRGTSFLADPDSEDCVAESMSTPSSPPGYVSQDTGDTTQAIAQSPMTDTQVILKELRATRAELQAFRRNMELELADLNTAMRDCNARIDGLESRIDALEKRPSTSAAGNMDSIVGELKRELAERDQELLSNDIEVTNIPQDKGENLIHIVKSIGLKLGVTLDERDIVSADRVGGYHLNATNSAGPTEQRPRAIVVRLARRDVREELLSAARVKRGATTADLGLTDPPKRFYVNERLTRGNRQLFRKARDAAGHAGWRFVWTKRGRILARRQPGEPTHRIRTEADIQDIIKPVNNSA